MVQITLRFTILWCWSDYSWKWFDKSGNTLSVDLKANGGLVIESTEIAVDLAASSITGTLAVGDGWYRVPLRHGARTNLGLVIGTDVEPHSDKLTELGDYESKYC